MKLWCNSFQGFKKILETNDIIKEIYVPKRIYNIVTKSKN